jgi:hypothetical protein
MDWKTHADQHSGAIVTANFESSSNLADAFFHADETQAPASIPPIGKSDAIVEHPQFQFAIPVRH